MDNSPAEHARSVAAPLPVPEVGTDDDREVACAEDLPSRPVCDRMLVRKARCLDDPEILQRVLAGLLNLR